jgi:pentatricopeptide repeat protein
MQLAQCADAGHAARAIRICAEMKRAQVPPDVTAYNWLIHACAKQGLANECLAFLDDMEALNLKPTIETYNHIIYVGDIR